MPRIYVAGSSLEIPTVRLMMRMIEETSPRWAIAYDWPKAIAKAGSANTSLPPEIQLDTALLVKSAIASADAFVLVAPTLPTLSGGCFFETGFAWNRRIPIAVLGEWPSIFTSIVHERCESAREILAWLHEVL